MSLQVWKSDKIVNSPRFSKVVDQIFDKVDKDKTGSIDREELIIAICHLHFQLAKGNPGLTEPPTKENLNKFMAKYDKDVTDSLSREEFQQFARSWFAEHGGAFVGRLILSSVISMVVLPSAANLIEKMMPNKAGALLAGIAKVAFGIAFKTIGTALRFSRSESQ